MSGGLTRAAWPVPAATGGPLATLDGGARQGEADLWCSYAAVRALRWLGHRPSDVDSVVRYLRARQQPDGGFARQHGLPSDVWATYHGARALRDLGAEVPDRAALADWLRGTRTAAGGFAMRPGQPADARATAYACRLYTEVLDTRVPDRDALAGWLAGTQTPAGGLGWQPGGTRPDVRAGYHSTLAWQAAAPDEALPVRRADLIGWLRGQQNSDGGFRFGPGQVSCAWAAFLATGALAALDTRPADPAGLRAWLAARRLPAGGYERWAGHRDSDVWACFAVIGTLHTLGTRPDPEHAERLAALLRGYQLPGAGFTYRTPARAADSLATAAELILHTRGTDPPGDLPRVVELAGWLRRAQLPYEDGVMYMPGQGAELRCTLWAAQALGSAGCRLDNARVGGWLTALQNVDGGYGYWPGLGSDLVSTVSAVELAASCRLALPAVLDAGRLRGFLDRCRSGDGYAAVPDGPATLPATAQAARALALLGAVEDGQRVALRTAAWASPLGGFAATPDEVPDLISTYQAVLTRRLAGLPVDLAGLRRFLGRIRTRDGYTWCPSGPEPAGPVAASLGTQLAALVADPAAPTPLRLNL